MPTTLLFHGHAAGVFSGRKLEQSAYDSIAFRYVAANSYPDRDTVADFRRRFLPRFSKLFVQTFEIAHETGVPRLGSASLDRTKVKANASRRSALSYEYALKLEKQRTAEVAELFKKAQSADQAAIPSNLDETGGVFLCITYTGDRDPFEPTEAFLQFLARRGVVPLM
jgi:hypothetical protein